jgi:hypothetical protein
MISGSIGNYLTNVQTWGGILYNVKSYGAAGNFFKSDLSAFNEAIDSAEENGGVVYLPPGGYYIDGDLIIPSKVDFQGSGGGETLALSKSSIILGDNASIIIEGRNVCMSDLLITTRNPATHTKDGIVIGTANDNAGRFKTRNVAVSSCKLMGIKLVQSNGYEIDAQVVNNGSHGFGVAMSGAGNGSGGFLRIDAYGNGGDGVDLSNSSGNTLSILSQSNKGNGIHTTGWGNSITGYVEFNGLDASGNAIPGKYNCLLDGNASGNDVALTIWDDGKGNKISYPKGQLRSNNFIKTTDGDDFTKGGYFATTRIKLDSVSNILSDVVSPTGGDIIDTTSGSETMGRGIYKYSSAYGWLRLDGVTFRGAPGAPTKGMDIHDPGDNKRKYYDGAAWQQYSRFVAVPASATATGIVGDWSADASYHYSCYATNTWRRVAHATW